MSGQSGARSEKKRGERIRGNGRGWVRKRGKYWGIFGRRENGLKGQVRVHLIVSDHITTSLWKHVNTSAKGVMQKLNISPRCSQNCLHNNTHTNRKVNLIKTSQSSMTLLWATLDERQSDEETTTTSTSHNNKHNAPQTHTHTATMVTEWNPPTSW